LLRVLLRPIRFHLHSKLEGDKAMIALRDAPVLFRPAHVERPEERAAFNPLKPAGTKTAMDHLPDKFDSTPALGIRATRK
jgi:hypothetical protein